MVCKVPGGTEGEQVKGVRRCVLWKPWGTPVTPLDFKFFLCERRPSGYIDIDSFSTLISSDFQYLFSI